MPDVLNIGNPAAMSDHTAASQAAAVTADSPAAPAADSAANPAPAVAPAVAKPAEPAQVAAQSAPTQASGPAPVVADMPVQIDGRAIPLNEVTAGYQAAMELGLDDPQTRDFLTTVALAKRGDAEALAQIERIAAATAPAEPPATPQATSMTPGPPVVPAAQPATAASVSVSAPASAPVSAPAQDPAMVMEQLTKLLDPLIKRVGALEPYMQGQIQTSQLEALTKTFETKKEEFPGLARNSKASSIRILESWNDMTARAKAAGAAVPNHQDLQRLMATEEAYLAGAAPEAIPSPEVVRTAELSARIPGRPVPGRTVLPNAVPPQPPAAPVPGQVSTNMPVVGVPTAMPPMVPETAKLATSKQLGDKIAGDLAALGVTKP